MIQHGTPLDRVIAVDNGSTDQTRSYLSSLPLGGKIFNKDNLGCGVAWNQGALALQSEWTIIMNNDVLVSSNWVENLIQTAKNLQCKIISPALIEGALDYDFEEFSIDAQTKMKNVHRIGGRHAVCLAVHHSVWMDIGYFQPIPKLLGYEDTLFFNEADRSKITTVMTGASWLHHFGSITQTAMKLERGLNEKQGLSNRHNYKLLHQSWFERKINKIKKVQQLKNWAINETKEHNMSIHGLRQDGQFRWI